MHATWTRRTIAPAATTALVAALAIAAAAVLGTAGCAKKGGNASGETAQLNGAGATFPTPLYSKWTSEYNKLHPGVQINYQSIGSGGGIAQITAKTVDFGASDAPMKDDEMAKAAGILHIPTTLGAVVLIYNVPGDTTSGLKLTPDDVAGIFLGDIKKWNDPKLAKNNPDVKLPNQAITVVHRSDGSGTSAVFTDYLAKVSTTWKDKVGAGKSVDWPTGVGGKGNEGVSGTVKSTPGSIGYAELAYAKQNNIAYASVQNASGAFVEPSTASVSAAAAGALATMPADYRVSITNADGAGAYPISSFTYILVYQDGGADANKATALARFLWWAIHDGQQFTTPLDYAPLPAELVTKEEATLQSLMAGGKPIALP